MGASLRKLTLVCPREIQATLADVLDDIEPPIPGYTVVASSGHGPDTKLSSAYEKVRGAIRTSMFQLILPEERVQDVLDVIVNGCRRPQIAYWVERVEDFGRLT